MRPRVLYITFTDFGDVSSGSGLRPYKMYQAFEECGYEVIMLEGQQNRRKERKLKVRNILNWLRSNDADFCYIEPPAGPLFNSIDLKLIRTIRSRDIPVALFYRDFYWMYPDWAWPGMSRIKKSVLIHMQKRDAKVFLECCNKVYVPSDECIPLLSKLGFTNISALPPGCGHPKPVNETIKHRIMYVGNVREADGIDDLLVALDKINSDETELNVCLTLVTKKTELQYIANQKLLKSKWITVTEGSGEELVPLYAECDLGILPKKRHFYMDMAISVKVFEYLANNLPVITTDCPAMSKFVSDENCGIVCKDNSESIRKAIVTYYSDTSLFKKLKNNAFLAAQRNSWNSRVNIIMKDLIGDNNCNYE